MRPGGVGVGIQRQQRRVDRRHLRHGAGGRREARRAGRADLRAACCRRATRASRSPARRRNTLDAARIAELGKFVETAAEGDSACPASSIGLVQDGKVVFAGGFGVRELGGKQTPSTPTRCYMIASNTKALTTLLLAKLGRRRSKLTWETPVTSLLPVVQARRRRHHQQRAGQAPDLRLHRACRARTWSGCFEFTGVTPEARWRRSATMQPTSKFGELFQYSNPLAAAAGFVGGHVAVPDLELGAAYDEAMRTQVFEPLGHEGDDVRLRARAGRQPRGRPRSATSTASPRAR